MTEPKLRLPEQEVDAIGRHMAQHALHQAITVRGMEANDNLMLDLMGGFICEVADYVERCTDVQHAFQVVDLLAESLKTRHQTPAGGLKN